jgi:hypothetical protein
VQHSGKAQQQPQEGRQQQIQLQDTAFDSAAAAFATEPAHAPAVDKALDPQDSLNLKQQEVAALQQLVRREQQRLELEQQKQALMQQLQAVQQQSAAAFAAACVADPASLGPVPAIQGAAAALGTCQVPADSTTAAAAAAGPEASNSAIGLVYSEDFASEIPTEGPSSVQQQASEAVSVAGQQSLAALSSIELDLVAQESSEGQRWLMPLPLEQQQQQQGEEQLEPGPALLPAVPLPDVKEPGHASAQQSYSEDAAGSYALSVSEVSSQLLDAEQDIVLDLQDSRDSMQQLPHHQQQQQQPLQERAAGTDTGVTAELQQLQTSVLAQDSPAAADSAAAAPAHVAAADSAADMPAAACNTGMQPVGTAAADSAAATDASHAAAVASMPSGPHQELSAVASSAAASVEDFDNDAVAAQASSSSGQAYAQSVPAECVGTPTTTSSSQAYAAAVPEGAGIQHTLPDATAAEDEEPAAAAAAAAGSPAAFAGEAAIAVAAAEAEDSSRMSGEWGTMGGWGSDGHSTAAVSDAFRSAPTSFGGAATAAAAVAAAAADPAAAAVTPVSEAAGAPAAGPTTAADDDDEADDTLLPGMGLGQAADVLQEPSSSYSCDFASFSEATAVSVAAISEASGLDTGYQAAVEVPSPAITDAVEPRSPGSTEAAAAAEAAGTREETAATAANAASRGAEAAAAADAAGSSAVVPLLKLRPDVRPSFAMRFGDVVEELEYRQSLAGGTEQVAEAVHTTVLPTASQTEARAAAAALPTSQAALADVHSQPAEQEQQQLQPQARGGVDHQQTTTSSSATAIVDAIADRKFNELLTEVLDEAVLLCSPVKHRTPGPQQQLQAQQQALHGEAGEAAASSSSSEDAASVETARSDGGSSSCSRSLQPDWQSDLGSPSPWASPLSVSKWTAAAAAAEAAAGQSRAGEVHEAGAAAAAAQALELRETVCQLEPLLDGSSPEGESCRFEVLTQVF